MSTTLFKVNGLKGGADLPFLLGLYIMGFFVFLSKGIALGSLHGNMHAVFWGVVVGLGSWGGNVLFLSALKTGPAALTSPFVNLSSVLVILISVLGYGEILSWHQWVASAVMVGALVFLPLAGGQNGSISSKAWYAYVLGAAGAAVMRNGGLKVTEEAGFSNDFILCVAYLFSMMMCLGDKWRSNWSVSGNSSVHRGLSAGVLSGIGLLCYARSLATGPGSLAAPIFSGYGVVVVILSVVCLKERLNCREAFCLMVFLCGFFSLKILV